MTAAEPGRIVRCPRCDRTVSARDNRYSLHSVVADGEDGCPMSRQRIPVLGVTDADFEWRAKIVADLAAQVQDSDPIVVWQYLTALPADELQRMLVVALTAIPVDQTLGEMYAWVVALPSARAAVTA